MGSQIYGRGLELHLHGQGESTASGFQRSHAEMAILIMPSVADCTDGFGSNPLDDAVTGLDQSNCEEKSSLKERDARLRSE